MIVKDVGLLIHRKMYMDAIKSSQRFWKKSANKDINNIRNIAVTLIGLFISFVLIAGCAYPLKVAIERRRSLAVMWITFCDIKGNLCFVLNHICQIPCIAFVISGLLAYDGLMYSLMASAYYELEKIKYEFIELRIDAADECKEEEVMRQIGILVERHNCVLG
ncbi:hypothetical protein QE152_g10962 [Popillia japonica]|uniref:Uncharacterized protein n=1 Tax=Popillia japonica TaxID=7064 RepID=A0AAW1LSZ8_POPJA